MVVPGALLLNNPIPGIAIVRVQPGFCRELLEPKTGSRIEKRLIQLRKEGCILGSTVRCHVHGLFPVGIRGKVSFLRKKTDVILPRLRIEVTPVDNRGKRPWNPAENEDFPVYLVRGPPFGTHRGSRSNASASSGSDRDSVSSLRSHAFENFIK